MSFFDSSRLPVTQVVSAGDQVPLFVQDQGVYMSSSLNTIADYVSSTITIPVDTDSLTFVNSVADIRLVSKLEYQFVTTKGYYSNIVGGNGTYWHDAADVTSADNGFDVIVANDGGRWKLIFNGIVNVKQFGAKGDGITDATASIQAAINYVAANGGGTVFIPSGTYLVSSTLTITNSNLFIKGEGDCLQNGGGTFIITSSATGDIISFGDGITALRFNGISNLSIGVTTGLVRTSGAGVKINYCGFFAMRDMSIYYQLIGIHITSPTHATAGIHYFLSTIFIWHSVPVTGIGMLINYVVDLFMDGVLMNAVSTLQPAYGFKILNSDSIYASKCEVLHHLTGMGIRGENADSQHTWYFFSQCLFDYCTTNGVDIISYDDGAIIRGLSFINCWTSSTSAGNGVLIHTDAAVTSSDIKGIQFVGHIALNNSEHGIFFEDAKNVSIIGGTFTGNSKDVTDTYNGISVGANTTDFKISEVTSGTSHGYGATQKYGIQIALGCDNYTVTHNTVAGNITQGLFDGSAGPNKYLKGNITDTVVYDTNIALGKAPVSNVNFSQSADITGSTTSYASLMDGIVQTDVTATAYYLRVNTNLEDAATVSNMFAFTATKGTWGAGATVATQAGFYVNSAFTGATNNYAFRGALAASSGTYNLWMDGTATNYLAGDLQLAKTVTAGGTTGAQTIDKTSGSVNFAAAAASLVVTNSLVTTSSIIICTVATNDATMKSVVAVAGAGSFTITPNAVPTAETRVNFLVTN